MYTNNVGHITDVERERTALPELLQSYQTAQNNHGYLLSLMSLSVYKRTKGE